MWCGLHFDVETLLLLFRAVIMSFFINDADTGGMIFTHHHTRSLKNRSLLKIFSIISLQKNWQIVFLQMQT